MTLDQLVEKVDSIIKTKKEKKKPYLGRLGAWAKGEPLELVEVKEPKVKEPKVKEPKVKESKGKELLPEVKKVVPEKKTVPKEKVKLSKAQEKRLAEDEAKCAAFGKMEKNKKDVPMVTMSAVQQDEPEEQRIIKEGSKTLKKLTLVKQEKKESKSLEKIPTPLINRCSMCDHAISLVEELKVGKCKDCIELFGE